METGGEQFKEKDALSLLERNVLFFHPKQTRHDQQQQDCPVRMLSGEILRGLLFYDPGSMLTLVRRLFVEGMGLKGRDCTLQVQPAGDGIESWSITAYFLMLQLLSCSHMLTCWRGPRDLWI